MTEYRDKAEGKQQHCESDFLYKFSGVDDYCVTTLTEHSWVFVQRRCGVKTRGKTAMNNKIWKSGLQTLDVSIELFSSFQNYIVY